MAAILRSKIQELNNTKFIFSGSSRHILNTMFLNYNQPFYKSALTMDLDIIGIDAYKDFVKSMFEDYGRSIDADAVEFVYYLMSGNTFNMQEVMKETFMITEGKTGAGKEDVVAAIHLILDRHDEEYREQIGRVSSLKDRKLLYCIANEGIAKSLTSEAMLKKYGLDNASSVQHSLNNLTSEKISMVQKVAKAAYMIQDRLFELWLALKAGALESKFRDCRERFEEERESTR